MAEQEEILSFGVFVDIRDALKSVEKFQKEMSKTLKTIAKSSEKMGKAAGKASEQAAGKTDKQRKAVEDLGEAYEENLEQVSNLSRTISTLSEMASQAHGDEKKSLEAELQALKKIEQQRLRSGGPQTTKPKKGGLFFGMYSPQKVKAELKAAGEGLKEPLQAFLSKDAKGLATSTLKSVGANFLRGAKLGRGMAMAGQESLSKAGARKVIEGKATGGTKGKIMQAAGGGMKGLATVLGKMGKAFSFLTKLGPILGVMGSGIMALVKLFIDADAMVKEFNKSVLQSASNLEFLREGQDSVNAASMRMDDTLKSLRESALDYETNLRLGITKDDHVAMINVLTQEGVTLERINSEAEAAGQSVREFATNMTATSVAYQRAFGVPLQEINQLQAEMMTEMGRSLGETTQAFAMMTRSAAESGIAGNKFFAAIRGVSADLGLYNLRLEDSVSLLGKMGKVMNPRNAQKFMQEVTQGMKSMGRQEKLQLSLLAGSKNVAAVVERDIKRKTDKLSTELAKRTGESAEEVRKRFEEGGYSGIKDLIDTLEPSMRGAMAESAINLELQSKQASKGMYGRAMSTADLGIGGALEVQQKALTRFTGGKSISDAIGSLGLEQVAEKLGKSDEQVKALAKLEIAVNAQRDQLIQQGQDADTVNKMGYDEIIDSMSKEMQEQIKADAESQSTEEKMLGLAQRQGQNTQSIQQKLEVLVDWFMGAFYDVILDIWTFIAKLVTWGSKADIEAKKEIYRSKDTDLIKAFEKAYEKPGGGGAFDQHTFRAGMAKKRGQQLVDTLSTGAGRSRVGAAVSKSFSGEDIMKMAGDLGGAAQSKLRGALTTGMTGSRLQGTHRAKLAGAGEMDYMAAFTKAGLSPEQQAQILAKAFWQAPDAKAVTAVSKALGPGQAAPATSGAAAATPAARTAEKTAETQVQEAAKSAKSGQEVAKAVTQRGIKVAPVTIKQQSSSMEQAMLSALRTALFEYYLYSDMDRGQMLTAMVEGTTRGGTMDPRLVSQAFAKGAMTGGGTLAGMMALAEGTAKAPANASGGMVTGIANGMAVVAAQGEGLASVAKGERIVPPGGGGGGVSVVVNGIGGRDLANLIEGKVTEGIREYKRRERFAP